MAGYKWGTVPKDEKEYQEYLKQSKNREQGGSAAAPQYEQTTTSRNSAYKPGTVPRTQEEYQAYRQYQQAKDQRERQKAAEQQTWDKWKDRFDLKHQREALESAAPTATGNKDADWAGYYANEANYYARYGNKTGYDNSYQKYKDLADKVGAQYDSHLTLHQKTDTTNPAQSFEAQEARYNRDSSLYNRMAQDAAKIGSQEMWDKASSGYGKAVSDYIAASVEEQEKANQAYKDWTDELHDTNRGAYFGETLTEDQIEGQIRMLERQKAELEPQVGEAYNAWANPGADETNETVAYSERLFRGRDKRLQEIEDQLAVYQAARRYKDRTKYASLRAQYAPDGRIAPEMAGKVRLGMDRYKADKDNALASANEAAANLENAKHLDYEDEAIFYALYADNPEEAVKWAKMAKEAQDEAWQGEIAEWAGQNTGTRVVALVGGTLARWGSGVANFFAPYSEDVLEMNRFGNALVSGGAQGLTEKGIFNSGFMAGTIDENTPIVGYVLGGKGLGDLYQLGSSIMESTATAYVAAHSGDLSGVVSALGTIIMGSSASVSDYDECIKRGLTERQALFHALAAGINEAAFEFISLDKLVNPNYGASALKQWFQQAGIEASEEFCTTVANTLADGYLARRDGYDTSVEQRAKELIAMGMDHDAAVEQAGREWTTDLINDALGGFISGGFSQGVNTMTGYAMSKFGDVADQIQYDNYMTKALEQQGAMTGANEAQALQSFAAANDIAFDEAAAQGVESRQPGVSEDLEGTTLAQQAEQAAQTKQTRREKRQEQKSNRSLGAVQEQVVSKLAENVRQAGLNNAQQIYEEQVGKHGDGIARSVQTAVARVAAEQFTALSSDSMEKANAAYKAALDGTTSQPVRNAIKQGYDMAVEDAAYSGSKAAQSRYLQDKLTGWGKGGALNLNAEIATKDGKTEQVQIVDLGNEKGKVKLSNGETVSVKSLQGLDADVADVIQQADRFDLGTARSLMWRDYQLDAAAGKITDGVRWIMSYAMAFDQGRRGIKTLQEAQAMSSLDEDVVRRAYQQGAEATEEWRRNQIKQNEEARSKAPEGVTGKKGILDTSAVSEETMKNLSADKKQALKTIEMLANALGVDFHIIEQAADENGNIKGWQGKYNLGENTIEIDINAGINNIYKDLHTGILAVTGHELTHWMQENAPTEYLAYKRAVLSAIESGRNGHTTLERLIDQVIKDNKKNGLELTQSQAEDEVVADASMKRLGDQEFWDAVSGNLGEQKQGVVAKLKEFFSKFFAKIREIIEKTSHMAEAAQLIDQAEKAVQDTLRKLYAEGIGAAMRGTSGQFAQDGQVHELTASNGTEVGIQDGTGHSVYSTRDYSEASDLELMENAAEYLSEAGGEEYWKALLKSAPELENQSDEAKRLLKDFQAQAKKLEAARREMTLTQRKLNTTGISGVVKGVMQYFTITDAKKNGIVQKATQALTEGYQEALNAVDKGKSEQVLDITYNAAVKAAEILLTEGRITQNYGGKWSNVSAETRLGEDRQQVIDQMVAAVGADFALNRYRDAIPETAADRLVARTQREMQKKVDAQKEKNAALTAENQKLTRENEWVTAQAKASAEAVTGLNDQLQYLKEKLAGTKSMSSKERAKLRQQARNLNNRLQAAKEEAKAWKARAEAEGKLATQYGEKQAALLKKLQAQQEREQKILEGKLKPLAMQRLLRAVREAENKKVTQHKDEVFAKYKDNQKASQLRIRIKNLSDEMKRAMTKPTDGSYVPAALYGSMTKLADALDDLLAPGAGTKAEAGYRAVMDQIHALSAEYRAVQNMDDPVYSSEYDEEIQYQIDELVKTLQGANADEVGTLNMTPAKARELTTEELQKVYNILKYINYCMKTAKDMMSSGQFKSVYDAMRSIADQQQAMRSMNSLGRYGKMKRSRMLDSMNVMRAVEMMSNWDRDAALYQIMHQVEQGVVRSDAWMMDYNKSLQDLKTGKNEKAYREALAKKLDYSVTDKEGLPVKMTKMQAIQILMTAEREAANDKLVHLQKGGAVIRDALKIQDGKVGKASEQYIQVTPELIQRIQESLTEWDKAYMKAIRAYIAKEGKATNQVMYALKHRVLETEPNYVPYIVDKNYLDTKLDEAQAMSMWVKTPGSTNALKQKASQPVIIDGMDTVMAKHVKEIADYIGLALPIRDFSKVYNGKLKQGADENPLPVKETIDRNWAKKGQHLLTQSIIDVQGGSRSQSWSTAIAEHLNGLQSAFVKSALLINPSVTIKQAASYVAAGSILSRAALELANHPVLLKNDVDTSKAFDPATGLIGHIFLAPNGKTATRIYNEIDKYTSMHYQRRQGMSQYELANEANRSGPVRRMVNAIGANMEQNVFGHAARKVGASLNPISWIQRMDVATTATLWLACKEQAKMDGLTVNSQEYWQRTTELYERVLRETQPMYDSLHRTAFQKSHGEGLMQYLFPFRTVPIQNHGQLAAAYETLQASKNKSTAEKKAAAKFFRKTVWAQTESAFVFSLMTFIAAALKRKTKKYRNEDEEMGVLSVLNGLTQDTLGTLFSVLFPVMGSELWNTGSRLIDKFEGSSGYTYDAFSVGVVDLLNDLASSFDKIAADVGKMFRGEKAEDFWSHGLNMVLKAAKLAGIPADTIKTYWQGIKGNVEDIAAGRVPALNDESWERSAAVNAERYVKALEAGDTEKVDLVEAEMLQDYADAGKNETEAAKALKSKLTSTVKEKYEAGEITAQDARDLLVETGFYEEDDAWYKIDRWDSDLQHKEEDGYSYSRFTKLYDAIDFNQDIKRAVKDLTDHGYTEKDILSKAKTYLAEKFENGAITETQYRNMLARYVGITKKAEADELVAQVKAKARYAEFQRQYPDANVSQSKIDAYYDTIPDGYGKTMKQAGIPMETYITYCEKAATATGTDKDGDGKTDSGSKKAAIMQIINGLNLTRSQKDALYYLNNWSTKTISEAPWH